MSIIIGIIAAVFQLLTGMLMTCLWQEKKPGLLYLYLCGFFGMLCLFEITAVSCILMGLSLTWLTVLFCLVMLAVAGVSAVLNRQKLVKIIWGNHGGSISNTSFQKRLRAAAGSIWTGGKVLLGKLSEESTGNKGLLLLVILLFLLQVVAVFRYQPDLQGDFTMESVRTTLSTNTMFQYNAFTGMPLETELNLSQKLVTLPIFYSFLSRVFGLAPEILLYRMVPVWMLAASYAVYGLWAACMGFQKRIFFVFYGMLMLFGEYLFTELPYRFFHCGFMGETILVGIILPFLMYLFLRRKKPRLFPFLVAMLAGIPLLNIRTLCGYYGLLLLLMGAAAATCYGLKLRPNGSRTGRR